MPDNEDTTAPDEETADLKAAAQEGEPAPAETSQPHPYTAWDWEETRHLRQPVTLPVESEENT